ncbi:MAG: glycosyltransferase family 2 protein [Candidatus Pacebacteria bacterium]|nr:glycosyltransferase family 2 protein [Candidatus Paceibacterota bacterium]
MTKLSIVATLYNSAPYLHEFHARCSLAAKKLVKNDYEIILVDDGSPDSSLSLAVDIAAQDPHTKVIELSRNFGHHKAMMTGLAHAKGELVFLIDSDLEESPEWLIDFHDQMQAVDCDVVYGVQAKRRGGWFERMSGLLFYRLYRLLTGVNQPDNIITARLMRHDYVKALLGFQERELNIGSLWIVTGFKQKIYPVSKLSHSKTNYTLSKKLGHFVNAITSFSNKPLAFTFYSGLVISISAILSIFFIIIRLAVFGKSPAGYLSIVVSIWFFSGLIIFFLGLQGIYLSKIFIEVKQRPYSIIRKIHHQVGK